MRPGLIIAGRTVMAPSILDTRKEGDSSFANRAGIVVEFNGKLSREPVVAYDEKAGMMVTHSCDAEGHPIYTKENRKPVFVTSHGIVQAFPAKRA